jgi:hypothetical protein
MNIGMIFALLGALILIAFLLVFGLGAIAGLFNVNEQAQVQKVVSDLEGVVEELYYRAPGNSVLTELRMPQGTSVCFVNSSERKVYPERWKTWDPSQDIKYILKSHDFNIWYFWSTGNEPYNIEHLEVEESFCTIPGVEVYLENRGTYVSAEL